MTKKKIDKKQKIIIYILLIFTAIGWFLFIIGNKDIKVANFFIGTLASILAAAVCYFLLRNVDEQYFTEFETKLDTALSLRDNGIICIGHNSEMGEQFWINLIKDLDTSPNRTYFIGTQLWYWLKENPYNVLLQEKLKGLLKIISELKKKDINNESYSLCILLTDKTFLKEWKDHINNSIKDFISSELKIKDKEKFKKILKKKIKIKVLSKDYIKYSLVFCGDRLTVTPYISTGNARQCLTLDIRPDSTIGNLYRKDIDVLKRKFRL